MAFPCGSQSEGYKVGGNEAPLPQKNARAGSLFMFTHVFIGPKKLWYPMDVGGISKDDRVTYELGSGSLRQAVGILTPGDFRPVINTE